MSLPHDHFALLGLIDPPNKYYTDELRKMQEASSKLIESRYGDLLDNHMCQMVRTVDEWDCPVAVVKPGVGSVHPNFTLTPIHKGGTYPHLWETLHELSVMHLMPPSPELGVTITDLDGDVVVLPDLLVYESQYNSLFTCVNYPSPVRVSAHLDERIMNHSLLQRSIREITMERKVKYPDVVIECQPDVRWVHNMKSAFNNTKALLRKGVTVKPNLIGK